MSNLEIARLLRNIAAAYSIKDEKKFRFQIIAYQKAADTISNLTSELSDYYKEGKLGAFEGIGTTIKSHLEDLFKRGKVSHFERVLKDIPESVFPLLDIPSFGPKKAYKLVKEFRLSNAKTVIEDITLLAKKKKIAKLEGFGNKSEDNILRAISEYRLGKGKTTKMILPYAWDIADKIVKYLKKSKDALRVEPLGSLRRSSPTVGDIDIAVSSKNPKAIIDYFVSYPYKERVIEKGGATSSILVSGGRQVDLMVQPPESFGSLLQHFTGSKNHNVSLREYALKKGLSLSEYGIKQVSKNKKSTLERFSSEGQFYNRLGMDWIPPEIRENAGEIELAAKHNLPNLVELSDIKGDLHIHSDYPIEPSHDLGESSMQEFIDKAYKLNYEYIGFSEHNPSISKHTPKSIYSIISIRNNIIEQIKKRRKDIRIIKLLEVDILVNGNLAIDDNSLALLDAVIVSIHSSFLMKKSDMTKRAIQGLSNKKAKILAHPTGRILNERAGYELDWDDVFAFCRKNNKALEINSWPTRLDLTDSLIRKASSNGVKLIINTDSHEVSQMNMMKYGVLMARRGWAKKSDILNTLPYNKFIAWLRT